MNDFWALSDLDKLILVLKILLVAFGWGSLIICSVLIIMLTVDYVREYIKDWKEARREKEQKKLQRDLQALKTRTYAAYTPGIAPAKPTDQPKWADETTRFMRIVEEIKK